MPMKEARRLDVVALFAFGVLAGPALVGAVGFPELSGWQRSGEVQVFGPDNLWQYNNGAAELYLAYGFQQLQVCDLTAGEVTLSVGIYDLGSRLNAYGMYNAEKGEGQDRLPIGVEAVLSAPYQGLLLKGIHYVKVDAFQGGLTAEVGEELLKAIAASLPGADRYPEELLRLPAEGRIAGSEGYVRGSYLGLGELRNCAHAAYELTEERTYQGFLVLPEPPADTKTVWQELSGKWRAVEGGNFPILVKKIPYRGLVGLGLTENGIIGVADARSEMELVILMARFVEAL